MNVETEKRGKVIKMEIISHVVVNCCYGVDDWIICLIKNEKFKEKKDDG